MVNSTEDKWQNNWEVLCSSQYLPNWPTVTNTRLGIILPKISTANFTVFEEHETKYRSQLGKRAQKCINS